MALPFLNQDPTLGIANRSITVAEAETLPDHLQLAQKMAIEINQYEDPARRIEMLNFIKCRLTDQFMEEKQYHTQRRESATTMIQSIESCLSTL